MKTTMRWVLFCASSLVLATQASAAPITLRFEAEIVDVDVLRPSALSNLFSPGESFSGVFSFEPVDVESEVKATATAQTLGLSIDLFPFLLHAEEYTLNAVDDFPIIDGPGFTDALTLRCGFGDCGLITAGNGDPFLWSFSMPLGAEGVALDGADLPSDVNVWNQFVPSFFSVRFQNPGVADVVSVSSRVSRFHVIPEPASFATFMLIPAFLALLRNGYRHAK